MKTLAIMSLLALAGAACLRTASAEVPGPPGLLPPEAVVRAAVAQSPDVQAAEAAFDATRARADGLRAGTAETVVRAIGQSRRVQDPTDPNSRYREGQIAVERPLRLWGKGDADARWADATLDAGQLSIKDARHETTRQILSLWFAAMRAGEARQAAEESDAAAARLAATVERRVQVGDAARLDLDLANAERSRVQAALTEARATERAANARLQALFPQLPLPTPGINPGAPWPSWQPDAGTRQRYIEDSHEYLLALAEESKAFQAARRIDLDRHPDPTVGVFISSERGGREHLAGMTIALPLGSALRDANARAAAADAETSVRRRLALERRLAAEFDVAAQALLGRRGTASALAQTATLLEGASDRAVRAYQAGEFGLPAVLAARRSLSDAALASRLAGVDAWEAESRMQLDLHRMWDFDE